MTLVSRAWLEELVRFRHRDRFYIMRWEKLAVEREASGLSSAGCLVGKALEDRPGTLRGKRQCLGNSKTLLSNMAFDPQNYIK